MTITPEQKRFFDDFGYLFLPGLLVNEVDWIIEEFERNMRDYGPPHDGTKRTGVNHILERSERFCSLLDHPDVDGLLGGLMGADYNYLGSAGELYVGGGMWHPDCHDAPVLYLKWAMYLDYLTRETGTLRVVPGSHKQGWIGNLDTGALWGISMHEVPCVAPENRPGDVMVFNLATLHNSLNGGNRRRMLNMVCCAHCSTEEEQAYLRKRLPRRKEDLKWDTMLETASPGRLRHLRQPLEMIERYGEA